MIDRFLLYVFNAIALIGGLAAFLALGFAVAAMAAGFDPNSHFALAATISIVTYCFSGTLHRIVDTPSRGQ
jgi:hypothetical protein